MLLFIGCLQWTADATAPFGWAATGNDLEVASGQLGMIVTIFPANPRLVPSPHPTCSEVVVLMRLDSSTGPVVQVPVVTRGVLAAGATGEVYEVDVEYMPLRAGWATTVSATQGLEFPHVLLDLNRADWLAGGGYSGVGRVKGDLRHGLRIMGGFSGNRSVFATDPAVLDWYQHRVFPML